MSFLRKFSLYFISLFMIIFCLFTVLYFPAGKPLAGSVENNIFLFLIMLSSFVFLFSLFFVYKKFNTKLDLIKKHYIKIILLSCLIPRIIVFFIFFNLPTVGDYNSYFILADALSNNSIVIEKYISIFPHVLGYPTILSFFFRIFGSHIFIGQIINVIFSLIIALLIYKIGKIIFSEKLGFITSILWCFMPSQILYTVLLCTEYFYTALFLFAVYTFLNKKGLLDYMLAGVICVMANSVRPLALILIIAFVIYDIIFENKIPVLKKIIGIFIMLLIYITGQKLVTMAVESTINTKVSTSPIGFNLYVGMNYNNKGTWNSLDSAEFDKMLADSRYDAQAIQDKFKDRAFKRIEEYEDILFKHIRRKHSKMWMSDHEALVYVRTALKTENKFIPQFIQKIYIAASTSYYYAMIIGMIFGVVFYIINKKYELSLLIIILIGTILVHVLVEVGGRYHFSCIPLFILIASYGIVRTFKEKLEQV